ncbi:reverse transcriptase domain-containing protein [Tanacetum coccineum]
MAEEDNYKTDFFTGKGVFCHQKMPFGLKNAEPTYQRLVDKVFSDQIGRNLKAYVDDMVIKNTSEEDMLKDIQETFDRFRSINMKLNPKKCSFGVEDGLFLGHLITKQGIRANPSKVKAVTDLDPPKTLKDVQSLNENLAALSRWMLQRKSRTIHSIRTPTNSLGSLKFLAIAVEHSTKWVEAKPLTTDNGRQAEKFMWEHVICRSCGNNEPHREAAGAKLTRVGKRPSPSPLAAASLISKSEESMTREKAKRKEGEKKR